MIASVQITAQTLPVHLDRVAGAGDVSESVDDFLSLAREHLVGWPSGTPCLLPEAAAFFASLPEHGGGWTESLYDEDRRQIADACLQASARLKEQFPSEDRSIPSRLEQMAQKFAGAARVVLTIRGQR